MAAISEDTGPERRSDRTKAAILRATRERLAAHGYDRTTIRAVAADAGIDPSMVMRYFGNKAQLFDAALDIDLRVPDLTGAPPAELPRMIVRHFLDRWESDPGDDALLVLMRSAVTNEHAATQMRAIFAGQVAPALAAAVGPEIAERRAGLVAAQLLGLGLARYLLRLPAVTTLSRQEIEDALTPAIQATLELTNTDSTTAKEPSGTEKSGRDHGPAEATRQPPTASSERTVPACRPTLGEKDDTE